MRRTMSRPFQAFFLLFIHLVLTVFDPISPPRTRMLRHVRLERGDVFSHAWRENAAEPHRERSTVLALHPFDTCSNELTKLGM
jgi:hypothetical protein